MPKAGYVPRNPRSGVLYPLVKSTWPRFVEQVEATGAKIPEFVTTAFESYLRCAIPEAGFLRLGCVKCGTERALPLSCKRRGLCPSCGARRMHDLAHQLVERVLPDVAIRQYVLSPPSELVGLLGARKEPLSALSRIFVECVFAAIRRRVGAEQESRTQCGSIVVVQRFTKTIALFPHLHVLVLDGGYVDQDDLLEFRDDPGPSSEDVVALEDDVAHRFERWLHKHGYLDEDQQDEEALDDWFGPATNDFVQGPRPVAKRKDPYRFVVHAKVRVATEDRRGREQLCAYVARPPLAEEQLEWIDEDRIRLTVLSRPLAG